MNLIKSSDLLRIIGLIKAKPKNLNFLTAVLMVSGGLITVLMIAFLIVSGNDFSSRTAQANNKPDQYSVIKIGRQEMKVEIASTFKQQYQGLSDRQAICADCGMLFVFSDSDKKSFVMRNMEFPLDMIFIDNGVIKNIAADLEPEGDDPKNIYESDGESDQVLEVNGGYCQRHNIKPGDRVSIKQ